MGFALGPSFLGQLYAAFFTVLIHYFDDGWRLRLDGNWLHHQCEALRAIALHHLGPGHVDRVCIDIAGWI